MFKEVRKKVESFPGYLKSWVGTFKGGLTIFCLIILLIIPLLTQNAYYLGEFFTLAMIYAIFAASWDLLAGIAGQVSFGHAIFFAISGYISSAFIVYFGFPWIIALFIGSIIAVVFGLLIAVPCLRLKGPYLALGTMSFGLILFLLFTMGGLSEILGGSGGISKVPPISLNPVIEYIITLFIMVIAFIIIIAIAKSNFGTILKSIRDDERGSDASGINTTKYKIFAFMISGFFAGIAGALFAMHYRGVNPAFFQPLYSFYAIVIAALGGIATIRGSALGAFFFVIVTRIFENIEFFADVEPLFFFSIILIFTIRFAERGIITPAIENLKDLWDLVLGK